MTGPSADVVRAMAIFLGIEAAAEPQLLWLAEKAILAPLSAGWHEYEDSGVTYFANGNDRSAPTTYDHPNDKLFAELVAAVREGAIKRSGWELHWTDDGLPYFFHAASAVTQWTIPEAVTSRRPEPEPEREPEPPSDSDDEELVAALHAAQAKAAAAKLKRAAAKKRRERKRKEKEEQERQRQQQHQQLRRVVGGRSLTARRRPA